MVLTELTSKVKFPAYNVPSIAAVNDEQIEIAAEKCREVWKLGAGPIQHIGRVAERNGVILVRHLQHADKIDAFARRGTSSMIVLNTARISTSRRIFDVAHELGHFVLHEGVGTGSKVTEEQANNFASAFLLPRQPFAREFKARPFSWTHVFELKRRWMASAGAIIRRAFTLSLLDPITYRRCYQYMSMRGWVKNEPYEPDFVGPEWLSSAFTMAAQRFGLTASVICEKVGFTPQLFKAVTGLELESAEPARFRPRLVSSG